MSLMKESNLKTRGLRILLTYSEIRSVGWPLVETISLPGGVYLFFVDFGEDAESGACRIFRKKVAVSIFVYVFVLFHSF